jgi:hypothetical protein
MAEHSNVHVPFYVGAAAIAFSILVLATGHRQLRDAEQAQAAETGITVEERLEEETLAEEYGSA